MDFDGISLTGPVCHIRTSTAPGVVGAGAATGAAPLTQAQVVVAATAVTANADNQVLIMQQAAATVALAATLPIVFNSNNLPAEAKARYKNHVDTTFLMTNRDMQPFSTPLGGVCPFLSYPDLLMGTGVTRQSDSNRLIPWNGQFFTLADQGNSGLKVFLASVPSCNGTLWKQYVHGICCSLK